MASNWKASISEMKPKDFLYFKSF